jgi:hypothetical protein
MIVIVMCNPRHTMARISIGINHDSTVVGVELFMNAIGAVNVEFIY